MSIKITIKFMNADSAAEKSSKLAIPKSWGNKTVGDVIGLFTKSYNDKNEVKLVPGEMHLVNEDGTKLYSDAIVSVTLGDYCDYTLRHGANIKFASKEETRFNALGEPLSQCKNYGCQRLFDERENTESSCIHHTGPPIFRDIMKCWSCCLDRKAYEFEEFQLIKGCATGKHSTVDPAISLHNRHTVFQGDHTKVIETETPVLKSIADFNKTEGGITAADDARQLLRQPRKSSRHPTDGSATCQRKGCGKTFLVESNTDKLACSHHVGQPVFRDICKSWSCCPEKKTYDFDDFLAIPGCAKGIHDDGVVAIES